MSERSVNLRYTTLGVALLVAGVGLFVWYNTTVLDAAEIERLEAGGQSASGFGELLALVSSPLLVLAGTAMLILAWSRARRQRAAAPGSLDTKTKQTVPR